MTPTLGPGFAYWRLPVLAAERKQREAYAIMVAETDAAFLKACGIAQLNDNPSTFNTQELDNRCH